MFALEQKEGVNNGTNRKDATTKTSKKYIKNKNKT